METEIKSLRSGNCFRIASFSETQTPFSCKKRTKFCILQENTAVDTGPYCPNIWQFSRQVLWFSSVSNGTTSLVPLFWRELNLPLNYKSMKRVFFFTLVSLSVQSTVCLQLELWKTDTDCITVTEVIYPSHAVLCNSISHLAWAEGDTQKSIPIATP